MATILEWVAVSGTYGYKIQRSPTGAAGSYTEIATDVVGPTYLDAAGSITDFYIVEPFDQRGDLISVNAKTTPVEVYEVDDTRMCLVSGTLVDASGRPLAGVEVRIYERPGDEFLYENIRDQSGPDAHQLTFQNEAIEASNERFFQTNAQGKFEIYLLRDILVVLFSPEAKMKIYFMVPDQDQIDVKDIENNVGYKIKMNNPF
jgi:hypothetical protein